MVLKELICTRCTTTHVLILVLRLYSCDFEIKDKVVYFRNVNVSRLERFG